MKICLIIDDHMGRAGGVQEYVKGVYKYLHNKGNDVWILSSICPKDQRDNLPDMNIKEIGTTFPWIGNGSQTSPIPIIFNKKPLKEFLDKHKFDILHVQAPYSLLSMATVGYSKAKKVFTFHVSRNDTMAFKVASLAGKLFYSRSWKKFDKGITVSKEARRFAMKYFPKPESDYVIIPNAIDTKLYSPNNIKIKKYYDQVVSIIFVGRLDTRKGILDLLKAYQIVEKKSKNEIRLLIIGKGPQEDDAKKYVDENKLANVFFLSDKGFVTNKMKARHLATSDIGCYPSLFGESFGIVLIEAMASGLPIVAYSNKGYRTVLGELTPDLLVEPGDYKQLAEKLSEFVNNKSLRDKIGERNYLESKKYSWERVGRKIVDLYKSII